MSNNHAGDRAGPKGHATTRFKFLNINGVNLRSAAAAFRDVFEDQRQMETDLTGLEKATLIPLIWGEAEMLPCTSEIL
jgi:hypothetical protein